MAYVVPVDHSLTQLRMEEARSKREYKKDLLQIGAQTALGFMQASQSREKLDLEKQQLEASKGLTGAQTNYYNAKAGQEKLQTDVQTEGRDTLAGLRSEYDREHIPGQSFSAYVTDARANDPRKDTAIAAFQSLSAQSAVQVRQTKSAGNLSTGANGFLQDDEVVPRPVGVVPSDQDKKKASPAEQSQENIDAVGDGAFKTSMFNSPAYRTEERGYIFSKIRRGMPLDKRDPYDDYLMGVHSRYTPAATT